MLRTGYIQDLPDRRDRTFEGTSMVVGAMPAPESYSDMASVFDIHLPQSAESCVGYSLAEALYASWKVAGFETPKLASPLFIWWNSRKTHSAEKVNSGTYIRMALRQMKRLGFCDNSVWPGTNGEDMWNYAEKPSRLAYRCAIDQKLTSLEYYRITGLGDERVESWKLAISRNNPVVFGVPFERSFVDWNGEGVIESPGIDASILGGHAMCALGYDERGPYGPQTWHPGYGNNGWFHISWRYVKEWGLDQWAIRAPQYFSEVTN